MALFGYNNKKKKCNSNNCNNCNNNNNCKTCNNCETCNIDYIKNMLIPILILIVAWFVTGADKRYHLAALIFLILSLCFISICTW